MIKVNKNEAEMIGAPLDLAVEIGVAVRALAHSLKKVNIPTEPLKKSLIEMVEAAFECDLEPDKEEIQVKSEETDTLDKVADLLAGVLEKLEERRGGSKNG